MIKYINKYNFEDDSNITIINNLITDLQQKKFKFNIDNNKYSIFSLYSSFYCIDCDNFNCSKGYCDIHYNKFKLRENNYINTCIDEFNNNYNEIITLQNKYKHFFSQNIIQLRKIMTNYFIYLSSHCNFTIQKDYAKQNIKYLNDTIIDYQKINVNFDKKILENVKTFLKTNDISLIERNINIYNMIQFISKKYSNYQHGLNNLIYHIRHNKITDNYKKIENNIILYNRIMESHLINYIDFIDIEYSLFISKHMLRADIYLLLHINNNYFEVIIETDEKHHLKYKHTTLKYDYYKDKYAIENGISIIRININNHKINNNNINLALFCINYIIETQQPIYYFNKKYIEYMNTNNDKLHDILNNNSLDNKNTDNNSSDSDDSEDNDNLLELYKKYDIDINKINNIISTNLVKVNLKY